MKLENQLSRVRNQMLLEGYSCSGINIYDQCWEYLKIVAKERGFYCYSEELAEAFLNSKKEKDKNYINNEKKYQRSLELIRCFLVEGTIAPPVLRSKKLSGSFQITLDEYINWLISEKKAKNKAKVA